MEHVVNWTGLPGVMSHTLGTWHERPAPRQTSQWHNHINKREWNKLPGSV